MLRKAAIVIVFTTLTFSSYAQLIAKNGEWKDHLSFNSCNTVAKAGNIVYVSNGAGLTKYNLNDNSLEPLNKINGLSDIGITLLRYNPNNDVLLVIYNNANIDVIKGSSITNFPDIKQKTITGKKNINEVTFKKNLAYLSCGFGIVVFDTDKMEVKDTYYIGSLGSYLNVYQVEFTDSTVFAATTNGLYKANLSKVLNDYQNWKLVTQIPSGTYNGVAKYLNKIYTNYSPWAANGTQDKDSLYCYDGASWAKDTLIRKYTPKYFLRRLLQGNSNYLSAIHQFGYESFDASQQRIFIYSQANDVYMDLPNYWIADQVGGFIVNQGPFSATTKIDIEGTHSNRVGSIFIKDGKILIAPEKIAETGVANYSHEGLSYFDGKEWQYIKDLNADTIKDFNHAIIDKNDPGKVWASSWISGLVEIKNNKVIGVYNSSNSSIPAISCCPDWHRVAGLAQDADGNIWMGNSDVSNVLTVRKTDGTFINVNTNIQPPPFVGRVMVDKNKQIWVAFPRATGLVVVKNNNFQSFDKKIMGTGQGVGKLPDLSVSALAEDQDGHVWIGTAKGIAVFYNPGNIFTGADFDCQQIKITQDGHVQILLETERVTAIVVDGANRKWVGTEASGVYCFSPDGQQQIHHFYTDNSPIFSNLVVDLAYDDVNGDIFIGTDLGTQSFRASIVKGEDEFNNVHAYPNPVRPGYAGNVYLRGLIDEAIVKITDISGNLVWETRSEGGQIEWPLKNLSGKKVSSGVYIAYCAAADGSQSAVAKILVQN